LYIVILWLATAYWAFRDMQQRSENPVLPYLAAALIVLFTPLLFVFGVIVYRIIRPHEKIADVYERNLAEEALLAEVETIRTCPSCSRRVSEEWIICPSCRTRLNRVCANCGRLVGLDWSLCAWCGKDFERGDVADLRPLAAPAQERIAASTTPADPTAASTTPAIPSATPATNPPASSFRSSARPTSVRGGSSQASKAPGSIPEP
jgi:RNA polymerase subunit RPABC4/transcription elongation factor Spt4